MDISSLIAAFAQLHPFVRKITQQTINAHENKTIRLGRNLVTTFMTAVNNVNESRLKRQQ